MSVVQTKTANAPRGGTGRTIVRYLRHRWVLFTAAGLALALSAALSWNWLVAAGIASVVLSLLPCLVMCGLGLCMQKFLGNSDAARAASPEGAAQTVGNRTLFHVTSCCGAGGAAGGNPANAPADGAPESKEKTDA